MQQSRLPNQRIFKLRVVVLAVFVTMGVGLFAFTHNASNASALSGVIVEPQQRGFGRRQTGRRRGGSAVQRRPGMSFSKFTHDIPGHGGGPKESCATCHSVASQAQPNVKDYPGHDSCINCHRQQFFSGARPAICSVCHTIVSPRSGARFDFPKPVATLPDSQFADIFPHRKHLSRETRLAFAKLPDAKNQAKTVQDTCVHCHKTDNTNLEKVAVRWPKDSYVPTPGTFMTSPSGHASCVECHWKAPQPNEKTAFAVYEPYINSCSECHRNVLLKPAPKVAAASDAAKNAEAAKTEKIAFVQAQVMPAHSVVPALPAALSEVAEAWSARVSAKFEHEIPKYNQKPKDDPHRGGCTDCHKQVSKVDSLETFRLKENTVQLAACVECHGDKSGKGDAGAIVRELKAREQNAKFDCVYCHSSSVGMKIDGFDDHYKAVKRTKPQPAGSNTNSNSGGEKK